MAQAANGSVDRTSLWASGENFRPEGPDFYRAHMAEDAAM